MFDLTPEEKLGFFKRTYTAVDGLWFMKVEEAFGFDAALDIDTEVWKVMPKIQARFLKKVSGRESGINALRECLSTRLELEGFKFKIKPYEEGKGFDIKITRCPWHDLIVQANREHLSGIIGSRICNTEYTVWAAEFSDTIKFSLEKQFCLGDDFCILKFST